MREEMDKQYTSSVVNEIHDETAVRKERNKKRIRKTDEDHGKGKKQEMRRGGYIMFAKAMLYQLENWRTSRQ